MVTRFLALLLSAGLFIGSGTAQAKGCAFNAFVGRSGEVLHFWTIQGDAAQFSWRIGDEQARASTIEKTMLFVHPVDGPRAWSARRSPTDNTIVLIAERLDGSRECALPPLRLGTLPLAFAAIADRAGDPWAFFLTEEGGVRITLAHRLSGGRWHRETDVAGDLRQLRLDPTDGSIWMGHWRFRRGAQATEWADDRLPPGVSQPETTTWYPTREGVIAVSSRGGWITTDGGKRWTPLPYPLKTDLGGSVQPIPSDESGPAITWTTDFRLHVASWRNGEWIELASLDRREQEISGPAMIIGGRVILLAGCYSSETGREWTKATIVKGTEVRTVLIEMTHRNDKRYPPAGEAGGPIGFLAPPSSAPGVGRGAAYETLAVSQAE